LKIIGSMHVSYVDEALPFSLLSVYYNQSVPLEYSATS
jgi:hypothetical protein